MYSLQQLVMRVSNKSLPLIHTEAKKRMMYRKERRKLTKLGRRKSGMESETKCAPGSTQPCGNTKYQTELDTADIYTTQSSGLITGQQRGTCLSMANYRG